jgi:hypothetical protein
MENINLNSNSNNICNGFSINRVIHNAVKSLLASKQWHTGNIKTIIPFYV